MTTRSFYIVVILSLLTVMVSCSLTDIFTRDKSSDTSEVTVRQLDNIVSGKWAVQVGAFTNQANAVAHGQKFADAGYNTYVLTGYVNGEYFDRVQIGPYETEAEAIQVRNDVIVQGLHDEAFVVRNEKLPD